MRQGKLKIKILTAALSLFISIYGWLCVDTSYAKVKTRQKSAVDTNRSTLKKIQKDIKDREIKIKKAREKENAINKELTRISVEIVKTETTLQKLKTRIASVTKECTANEVRLKRAEQQVTTIKILLAREIALLYKKGWIGRDRVSLLEMMIADRFSEADEDFYHFKKVLRYNDQLFVVARERENEIREMQAALDAKRKTLQAMQMTYTQTDRRLCALKQKQDTLLKHVQAQRTHYEKELATLKESADALQRLINRLLVKTDQHIPTREMYINTYRRIIRTRGKIAWPVQGHLLTLFGKQKHPELDTFLISNGIEIAVGQGANIHVVSDGTVVFCGAFKRYGTMIIVDHSDNVFTVYAYLNDVCVTQGQRVKKGLIIAHAGISSLNKIPALYFEVRVNGMPMDPMMWLK